MGLVPEELTPTALAKSPSWALVHEPSQDSRDAMHNDNDTSANVLTQSILYRVKKVEYLNSRVPTKDLS